MSAVLLREAAAQMRERAAVATFVHAETGLAVPWHDASEWAAEGFDREDGEHIASWTPMVALVVADLLDEAALTVEVMAPWNWDHPEGPQDATGSLRPEVRRSLAVARTYLGQQASA